MVRSQVESLGSGGRLCGGTGVSPPRGWGMGQAACEFADTRERGWAWVPPPVPRALGHRCAGNGSGRARWPGPLPPSPHLPTAPLPGLLLLPLVVQPCPRRAVVLQPVPRRHSGVFRGSGLSCALAPRAHKEQAGRPPWWAGGEALPSPRTPTLGWETEAGPSPWRPCFPPSAPAPAFVPFSVLSGSCRDSQLQLQATAPALSPGNVTDPSPGPRPRAPRPACPPL